GKYGPPSPRLGEVPPRYSTANINRVDNPEDRSMSERCMAAVLPDFGGFRRIVQSRSEEHTSELQSLTNLVCRLLLEKKNKHQYAAGAMECCRPDNIESPPITRTLLESIHGPFLLDRK